LKISLFWQMSWSRQNPRVMLNTLTQRNFQDAYKNVTSAESSAYVQMRTAQRMTMAIRPKIIFWPDDSNSPGNCDISLHST
jgi:ribosome-binding factor A